ncbi:MAG TPA: hypothetical protein VIG62_09420 [Blastocatellia bacterium]|jgi:hypothetical protein
MKSRNGKVSHLLAAVVVLAMACGAARADDKSFSSVVKHMKSSYKAKQQGFFGAMMLARFAVKVVKPAGVKNFKVAFLRDLDFSEGPRPGASDFHAAIRDQINPLWQPLVTYSAPGQKQWSYVYVTQEKKDVKLLVVAVLRHEAFVVQTKFSPEKLMEFMNDPKIMGISLKGDQPPRDGAEHPDDDLDPGDEPRPEDRTKPPADK